MTHKHLLQNLVIRCLDIELVSESILEFTYVYFYYVICFLLYLFH